jgi:CheY-like chemotaxis protein
MSRTVLVVEDEPLVRFMAMDIVEEAGFQVLEAADADEALSLLDQPDRIDIVFTDIRMPGSIDGMVLARTVRRRWPATRVIVASGHGSSDEALAAGADRFFAKPYQVQPLVRALHELR